MSRRTLARTAAPSLLVLTMLVYAILPSGAQTTGIVEDLLEEVGSIEGINQLDPILNPVSELILTITNAVDDTLAETPLVNTLALVGDDAVDAGVAFSQATFPDGASTAILGREDLFADGLASGAFQGAFQAPLLYTSSGDLDRRTGTELMRLGMDTVTILGGDDALDPTVVNKLELAGLDVVRIGGPTRVETAVQAADATHPDASRVVLVRAYPDAGQDDSQAYADLLSAGPFAAENSWPILMTTSDELHPAVAEHLRASGVTAVTVVGGVSAVSQAVEDGLVADGISVERISGANRFATAVAIAEARGFSNAAAADRVILAEQGGRDDVWAPGFSATAHAAQNSAPVLLTDGPAIPTETLAFLADGLEENLVDGGPAIICAPFVSPVACEAAGALMLLDLGTVQDLLGTLEGIPVLGDILAALDLAGLLGDALTTLITLLEGAGVDADQIAGILGALAVANPAQAQALIDGLADDLGLSVDDLTAVLDGEVAVEDVLGEVTDTVTDGGLGGVGEVIDEVLGGDGGSGDGGGGVVPTIPVPDAGGVVDGVVDGVGGLLGS